MSEWRPIETAPDDRYVLLFDPSTPDWDGNMEVGRRYGDCWWSAGGPNGGLELERDFTHWMPLPPQPDGT